MCYTSAEMRHFTSTEQDNFEKTKKKNNNEQNSFYNRSFQRIWKIMG